MDSAIIGMNDTLSIFIPMFLIFVFGTVFIGGFIAQKKRAGFADAPMWAVVASFATLMIALPLTISEGMIEIKLLSIVVGVTIFSGFWLFTSRSRNEV